MKPNDKRNEPDVTWTLQQLEQFIHTTLMRTSRDAWVTGKALKLARRKVKEEKAITWTTWKRTHGYSDTTCSRYIRLFEFYETADALAGMGVIEACERAGILARGKPDKSAGDKQAKSDEPYAWAIKENDDQLLTCLTELDDWLGDVVESGDQTRLQCVVALPNLRPRVESIGRRLAKLLDAMAAFAAASELSTIKKKKTGNSGGPTLAV